MGELGARGTLKTITPHPASSHHASPNFALCHLLPSSSSSSRLTLVVRCFFPSPVPSSHAPASSLLSPRFSSSSLSSTSSSIPFLRGVLLSTPPLSPCPDSALLLLLPHLLLLLIPLFRLLLPPAPAPICRSLLSVLLPAASLFLRSPLPLPSSFCLTPSLLPPACTQTLTPARFLFLPFLSPVRRLRPFCRYCTTVLFIALLCLLFVLHVWRWL